MSSKPEVTDEASYDVLVLSPHLDDAAFSVGGYLHRLTRRQGKRALVANVFTAEAPDELSGSVKELHRDWVKAGGFEHKIMVSRRQEEEAACLQLGVDVRYLGFLDAVYRRDEQGKPLYDPVAAVTGHRRPQDNPMISRLEEEFRQLPAADEWIVPMGVGHHVDHLLVRQAAERVRGRDGLLYYEDFPYARAPLQTTKAKLWKRLDSPEGFRGFEKPWRHFLAQIPAFLGWKHCRKLLEEDDLQAKIDAIACHKSQVSKAFDSLEAIERAVREFNAQGERLWHRRW